MTDINIDVVDARLLLLHGQRLLSDPTKRATRKSIRKLIHDLGFVQLDTISTVERAHHLILGARFDSYHPGILKILYEDDRALFEHWTHDASIIPIEFYSYWRERFRKVGWGRFWDRTLGADKKRILANVLERIEREGPLRSRDFEQNPDERTGPWWGWKSSKAALEYHWHTGSLAVSGRMNFQKIYDLPSRVYPDAVSQPTVTHEQRINWACKAAIERLGIATAKELRDFWNIISLKEAQHWCDIAKSDGRLCTVQIHDRTASKRTQPSVNNTGLKTMFIRADWEHVLGSLPRVPNRVRLLTPFDPLIRDRSRLERLFYFSYRFEGFVPSAKRKYGYYVMPMLECTNFIGRIDPKFDRKTKVLTVKNVYWENGIRATRRRRSQLVDAVNRLGKQIGACDSQINF